MDGRKETIDERREVKSGQCKRNLDEAADVYT